MMKINKKNINKLVNEVVKRVAQRLNEDHGEESGLRGARKAIISNILAKHPGFLWNKNVAWAYYTLYHQKKREGDKYEISQEMIDKVKEGLMLDKKIKADRESELRTKISAYKQWISDPSNYDYLEFSFDITNLNESDEEAIQKEIKRLLNEKENYIKKAHSFRKKVTLKRDNDNEEFETEFEAPVKLNNFEDILNHLIDALYKVQIEYGDTHFKDYVHHCANSSVEPTEEYKRRLTMLREDESNGNIVVHCSEELGRCYHCYSYPKYKLSESVDSSD